MRWAARGAVAVAVAALAFVLWPLPAELLDAPGSSALLLLDRDGRPLREWRTAEAARHRPLPIGPLPQTVESAFLAAEDHRFGAHPGVDPLAIARTLRDSLRAGRLTGGASTITQQLARRLIDRRPGWTGKAQEALWALRLNLQLDREQILRAYLDRVQLGNAVVGVEAAAQYYFGRPASALSLTQAALLAGIACAPARFDPHRHPDAAQRRLAIVLGRMAQLGMIDLEQQQAAQHAPWDLAPAAATWRAPHFTTWLQPRLPSQAVTVVTTLDGGLQRAVEEAVEVELAGLVDRDVSAAAVLVLDNPSGEILAWVGSRRFDAADGGQNDGVIALRQPGSSLKPFLYGLALQSGYSPAALLSDVVARYGTAQGAYSPQNYDRRQRGPVRLRAALANSYNIPAVQLCEALGPARLLATLHAAGYDSLGAPAEHYGLALALGDGEVALYEQARAYRGLITGGVAGPLRAVRQALDRQGRSIPIADERAATRFLSADAAALLIDMLSDERSRGPAFGLDNPLRLPFPMAAKTGTSRAHVDNWAIGVTRERTVAVWVGNFDGRPMRSVSGITGASPLLRRVMLRSMQGVRPAPLNATERFETAAVCALSGALAGPACGAAIEESFLPGTAPRRTCAMHRATAHATRVVDLGPTYAGWAQREGLPLPPPDPSNATNAGDASAVRLLAPVDGDQFLLDPQLPAVDQQITVRAIAPIGVTELWLRLGDGTRRRLESPFTTHIPALRGRQRLELWEPGERRVAARVEYLVR